MTVTTNDVLYVVLTVCLPFLIGTACQYIRQRYRGTLHQEAVDAVLDAVQNTNQTYVDTLKDMGKFDAEAQEIARQKTVALAIETMSNAAVKYLNKLCGSAEEFVLAKLEAVVAASHR